MTPALTTAKDTSTQPSSKLSPSTTRLLRRTPWDPPVAVKGEGIYLDLADGRRVIDGYFVVEFISVLL